MNHGPSQPGHLSHRPRRLRTTAALRDLLADVAVTPKNLIAPYFVVAGEGVTQPVASLPGVSRLSPDTFVREVEKGLQLGVTAYMLFGVVDAAQKNPQATAALDKDGPVVAALRAAREAFGNEVVLMTDVCLCAYTDHGHCGLLAETPRGVVVDNDPSLGVLAKMAVLHAAAGADVVAPSDMMDGRVGYIRQALDENAQQNVSILAYTAKYASAFYGPFRDAAGSSPNQSTTTDPLKTPPKDRKTYQMDYRSATSARIETQLDSAEGADMLLVKPALAYLDILYQMRQDSHLPLVAYHVSGEYAAIKAAAAAGVYEEAEAVYESFTAIRRAGADLILSYYALEAAEKGWLG